ncbi:hypothetical protein ACFW9I_08055 [[Kitasatospora] papulosa]|uniref:hypothetical protein n=1 Tax=[Kitasatospora] papulosa TaxID=1464011 RepID=UPI00368E9B91
MTPQDAVDYVNAFNGVALLTHTLWIRLRSAGPATAAASSSDAAVVPAARTAAALLAHLPAGAAARWEAPDGSAVTVWWVAPPADCTDREDFRLC